MNPRISCFDVWIVRQISDYIRRSNPNYAIRWIIASCDVEFQYFTNLMCP